VARESGKQTLQNPCAPVIDDTFRHLHHRNGCPILKIDDQWWDIEYCGIKAIGPVKQ
jgi:hypothetical protein